MRKSSVASHVRPAPTSSFPASTNKPHTYAVDNWSFGALALKNARAASEPASASGGRGMQGRGGEGRGSGGGRVGGGEGGLGYTSVETRSSTTRPS